MASYYQSMLPYVQSSARPSALSSLFLLERPSAAMAASNHSFVGINNFNGWNVTMYDSLDTMLLVDLHEEFSAALPIISKEDFRKITMFDASASLWFYCRQTNHCQAGTVSAVKPTTEKSFDP
ncbi:hypothetical protein L227DRAFT_606861 [Lentinus tigrinus ALCF2SS1-6]|uniref:Uncharacterized protein n=1 Tax=Lentinus tigrinus ALCF2SS1-6 TaxID=1328759 RepID=A0A5C2SNF4_9APHY|nr:hypothetical protein L227DRAFT_606861 [Lentinus tigrinus ALCF2SS1-6]